MMVGQDENHKKTGGFALVVVILVMLIISFMASQLILQIRTDVRIFANNQQRVVGRMLAEGGVNLALFRLLDKPSGDFEEKLGGVEFLHGHTYETVLSTGRMEYYAVSESGKIDLNRTHVNFIEKFLLYHGLEEDEVLVVIDSLLDWRDNDNFHRINGAEKNYYQGLDNPYIPRNGLIEDPAEFFLIRGTESLRGVFDPYDVFTVNNSNGKININNLSPDMLAFLAGGDSGRIDRYREEQELAEHGRITRDEMQEILGDGVYTSLRNYLVDSRANNRFYSIVSSGHPGDFSQEELAVETDENGDENNFAIHQAKTTIRVLVDVYRDKFQYLSWAENYR